MTIEHKFFIDHLKLEDIKIVPNQENFANVVVTADWRVSSGMEHNSELHFVESRGTVQFDPPNPETFVDISQITEEIVRSWVHQKIDVQSIKNELDQQLLDKIKAEQSANN